MMGLVERWSPVVVVVVVVAALAAATADALDTTTTLPTTVTTTAPMTTTPAGPDYSQLTTIVDQAIANHSFPGAVVAVANRSGILYSAARGSYTYGMPTPIGADNPNVTLHTLFDLASLTKVLATTTCVMQLFQAGYVQLQQRVADSSLLGPAFAAHGKGNITIENLLLHNAGYPPDPDPNYWEPESGCAATFERPVPEVFDCRPALYDRLLNQTLATPPGQTYVYSDLSMITMMYIVGTVVRTHKLVNQNDLNSAYFRTHVADRLGLSTTQFLPPSEQWSNAMPTWNDTDADSPPGDKGYRYRVMQGQVSDQNAYALGGISGHAGLFSTVSDIVRLVSAILFAPAHDNWINATTVTRFTTVVNVNQSSRALGWDTNSYTANEYRGCSTLSGRTFTHTGYTGTEVCADPDRQLLTVSLTNRVYPRADDASEDLIHKFRQSFNAGVAALFPLP